MTVCLWNDFLIYSAERFNVNGKSNALARAEKSQSHFNTVELNASTQGMLINQLKSKMLCISAAKSYEPQAYLLSDSGDRVQSTEQLRALGFHFDGSPNVRYHMKLLNRCFKCRIWAL